MSGDEEDRSGGGAAAEDSEQDGKAQAKRPAKHEDLGAADLEKVTDFVEEAEMSGAANIDALKAMEKKRAEQQSAPQQQLPKVKLNKEDVELIVSCGHFSFFLLRFPFIVTTDICPTVGTFSLFFMKVLRFFFLISAIRKIIFIWNLNQLEILGSLGDVQDSEIWDRSENLKCRFSDLESPCKYLEINEEYMYV